MSSSPFSHMDQSLVLSQHSNKVTGHYIFIISQLRLTSHPRSTVVLLDTGTPGTSREIYSEDAEGEARTQGLRVRASPSAK